MSNSNHIRLLIAEDDSTLRDALSLFMSVQNGIEVVGQAADTAEAHALSQKLKPDVLLIDLEVHPARLVLLIRTLCQDSPNTKIVVLASQFDNGLVEKVRQAGAAKYMVKGLLASEIAGAIRQVSHYPS